MKKKVSLLLALVMVFTITFFPGDAMAHSNSEDEECSAARLVRITYCIPSPASTCISHFVEDWYICSPCGIFWFINSFYMAGCGRPM